LTTSFLQSTGEKLETPVIGLILVYFFGVHLSAFTTPAITAAMNIGSYAVLIFLIARRWKAFIEVFSKNVLLLILMGLAIASLLWSAAPEVTSNDLRALVRTTCLGAYMATRYSAMEQMNLLAWISAISAVLSILASLASGLGFSTSEPWPGIFAYKNFLACVMLMGALIFVLIATDFPKQRRGALASLSVTLIVLFFSQAKTAFATFFIALYFSLVRQIIIRQYKIRAGLFFLFLVLTGATISLVGGNLEYLFVDVLGKNLEFNGRLPIWQLMFDKILEQPFLGYGIAGFWTSEHAFYVLNNSWAYISVEQGIRFYAHNGYIDLLLQLGFSGLLLFSIIMGSTLVRVVRLFITTKSVEHFWMLQFLIVILLYNLSETAGILTTSTYWSVVVSVILSSAVQADAMKAESQLSQVND
jgi:exopolysaccharide production protein ExoQ